DRLFGDPRNRHRFPSDRDLRVLTDADPEAVRDSAFFQPPANFNRIIQLVHDVVSLVSAPRRPCSSRNVDMRSAIARDRGIGPIAASKSFTRDSSADTPKFTFATLTRSAIYTSRRITEGWTTATRRSFANWRRRRSAGAPRSSCSS